jgi:CRISPR system Cascade subunit CasB
MPESPYARRRVYVDHLCSLESALRSNDRRRAAAARRTLAHLRHSFVDGRQYQAYETIFRHGQPPDSEEAETWLLLGGLFALHPLNWKKDKGPRSLGASLGRLRKKLDESPAVDRRLTVLLAKDRHSLPHHLRQAIRLLSAHDIPVNYGQLLEDLVVLLGKHPRGDRASAVRLRWAQEYYLPVSAVTAETSDADDLSETTE